MSAGERSSSSWATDRDERKALGAWYTPDRLVRTVVSAAIDDRFTRRRSGRLRVLDPACGDGRFLEECGARIAELGGSAELVGVDIDPVATDRARGRVPTAEIIDGDALDRDWTHSAGSFDLVVGNPPFVSQMAASTTRGGSSERGGGPYADVAVEFLALASELVDPGGGRVAYVLPQSLLSARDGRSIRARYDETATMIWSSWDGLRAFDAQVLTCAVAFEFGRCDDRADGDHSWSRVVTTRRGVPDIPECVESMNAGTLGARAWLNANFRDEYYAMIPAVGDHDAGPPLITSGLIDPGRSSWGRRSVRFAKRRFAAPRIDVECLDDRMRSWADRRLVPKVLVANQTPVVEAVADPEGEWLPGVPVVGVYPSDPSQVWEVAAVLTSPVASVWAWHRRGGTGMSADTIRIGPVMLAALPWPSGSLDRAVDRLRSDDIVGCGREVASAYDVPADAAARMMAWWSPIVDRVLNRSG